MMRFFTYTLMVLLASSCISKKEPVKNTFIFDFDNTLHNSKISYPHLLMISVFGENKADKKLNEIKVFIQNLKKDGLSDVSILQKMIQKYKIIPSKKDIDFVTGELLKSRTEGLKETILDLKSKGHKVLIIGGGTWGCAIIPEFAKQFEIDQGDIYSGYFKDFSNVEMKKALSQDFKYVNCKNLDLNISSSDKKSDLIKYLKQQNIVSGKIIHIGDEDNDLDVWKSGEVDTFIGFGVNDISLKVEKESPIFVKNIEEFNSVVFKYA